MKYLALILIVAITAIVLAKRDDDKHDHDDKDDDKHDDKHDDKDDDKHDDKNDDDGPLKGFKGLKGLIGRKHKFHGKYQKYLDNHGKKYGEWNETRKFLREKRFNKTLADIAAHNANPHRTFEVEVNEFADRLEEDLKDYHGADESYARQSRALPIPPAIRATNSTPPATLNYTSFAPAVTSQGKCGSCWAFSTIGMLATFFRIINNKVWANLLSEQYLVDCDTYDGGCGGGWPSNTLNWIKNQAKFLLPNSASYPYVSGPTNARSPTGCKTTGLTNVSIPFKNYYQFDVMGNVTLTKQLLNAYGPLVAAMTVPSCPLFNSYKSGIYNDTCGAPTNCTGLNHGVVLMGYGRENNLDYWIIRNSWNTTWGENGYGRIHYNSVNKLNVACKLFGVEV